MNEENLIKKLKEIIIPKIINKNTHIGRPYEVSNEQLIESIFLRTSFRY